MFLPRSALPSSPDPQQPAALRQPFLARALCPDKGSAHPADIQDQAPRPAQAALNRDIGLPLAHKVLHAPVARPCGLRSVPAAVAVPANRWEDPPGPLVRPLKRSRASLFTCASRLLAPNRQLKNVSPKVNVNCILSARALALPQGAELAMRNRPRLQLFASRATADSR